MSAHEIVPGLYQIPLGIVHAWIIDDGELMLVDTGVPGSADRITAFVERLGRPVTDITRIIATHAHYDHTGSLAQMQRRSGATVFMHPEDAQLLAAGESMRPVTPGKGILNSVLNTFFGGAGATPVEAVREVQLLVDGQVLPHSGGIEVIHVPGHCAGQVCLFLREKNTLIAADLMSHIAGLSEPLVFEDRALGLESVFRVSRREFSVACFGHGRPIRSGAVSAIRAWIGRHPDMGRFR